MVFSTSDVDTLNFNNFVNTFTGASKAAGGLTNLSATSPWNSEMFGGDAPIITSEQLNYILIAVIIYLIYVPLSTLQINAAISKTFGSETKKQSTAASKPSATSPTSSVSSTGASVSKYLNY